MSPEYAEEDEEVSPTPSTPEHARSNGSSLMMTPQSSRNKTVVVISESAQKEIKALKKVRKLLLEQLDTAVRTHRRACLLKDIGSIDDEIERIHRQFRD